MRIAERVAAGVLDLTMGPDTRAAATRHYSKDFIQHSPIFPGGWDGLNASIDHAKGLGASYEVLRAIGEGDHAVIHARVTGFMEVPVLLFNLYRVADDKIVEHWEGLQPEFPGMAGGATEVTDLDRAEDNRTLVRNLVEKVLIGGDLGLLDDYVAADVVSHHHEVPDGVAALRTVLTSDAAPRYARLHRIVVEGNFVYTLSEGTAGGAAHAFHDLFRVQDGRVAEHWDVVTAIPDQVPHDNGVF